MNSVDNHIAAKRRLAGVGRTGVASRPGQAAARTPSRPLNQQRAVQVLEQEDAEARKLPPRRVEQRTREERDLQTARNAAEAKRRVALAKEAPGRPGRPRFPIGARLRQPSNDTVGQEQAEAAQRRAIEQQISEASQGPVA